MALTPPSDIVLGVARAVDPQKYEVAAERLKQLGAAASTRLDLPSAASPPRRVLAEARPSDALRAPGPVAGRPAQDSSAPDAFRQLEAFVLQTFVQSMLPQNAETVFGKGTAGEIWKSMLAEQLASEIARSGQVGLAKRLASGQSEALIHRLGAEASGEVSAAARPSNAVTSALSSLTAQSEGS